MSIKHQAAVLTLVAAMSSTAQVAVPPQQPAVAPQPPPVKIAPDFLADRTSDPQMKKAYEALFKVRQDLTRLHPGSPGVSTPRTVCGLTVWNVDPAIDPRMRLQAPQPPDVTYAIRKLTPPVCQE